MISPSCLTGFMSRTIEAACGTGRSYKAFGREVLMVNMIRYHDIEKGLRELGLKNGDTLLVHSSLCSFGSVEGGPDTVIQALLDVIGSRGNLVMPTLSFSSINEQDPFFDVNETPSDCGIVTETFRKRPGVIRTVHPFSSAAVFGPDASYLAEDHAPTPCGIDSPYYKVYKLRGYSLFMGVGFKSNTLFHVAEEIETPPYMRYKFFQDVKVKTASGHVITGEFARYDCYQTGIVRELERMEQVFRARNVIREWVVGQSRFTLISASDNVGISCEILRNNHQFFLKGGR
jgi:aminoglycoside 3-N-acetyltransferase